MRSQVRGLILEEDSILTLIVTFLRVMRVSTRSDVSSAAFIEQSAMISRCGRGRGRDRDFGGQRRGLVGGGHGSYGGRQSALRKAPINAGIVDVAITSSKSIGKFWTS